MEIKKKIFDDEYLDTLNSINNLIYIYKVRNRKNEAVQLIKIVVIFR